MVIPEIICSCSDRKFSAYLDTDLSDMVDHWKQGHMLKFTEMRPGSRGSLEKHYLRTRLISWKYRQLLYATNGFGEAFK